MRLIDAKSLENDLLKLREAVLFLCGEGSRQVTVVDATIIAVQERPTIKCKREIHAHWIERPFLMGTTNVCSACGDCFGMPHGKYKYCPTCGAIMDEEVK